MEDVHEVSHANENKTAVFVRSFQALSSISEPLLAGIKSVINENVTWSKEEKESVFGRLREVCAPRPTLHYSTESSLCLQ